MLEMIYLNTDHLQRCIQTLESSLRFYQQVETGSQVGQQLYRCPTIESRSFAKETRPTRLFPYAKTPKNPPQQVLGGECPGDFRQGVLGLP